MMRQNGHRPMIRPQPGMPVPLINPQPEQPHPRKIATQRLFLELVQCVPARIKDISVGYHETRPEFVVTLKADNGKETTFTVPTAAILTPEAMAQFLCPALATACDELFSESPIEEA